MGNKKIIHYIATKEQLVKTITSLYEGQGYTFSKLDPKQGLPDDLFNLLLIEPLNSR